MSKRTIKKIKRNFKAYALRIATYAILIIVTISLLKFGTYCHDTNLELMEAGYTFTIYGWVGFFSFIGALLSALIILIFSNKLDEMDGKPSICDKILEHIKIN